MNVITFTLIMLFLSCESGNKFSIDITKMRFRRQQGIDAGTVMKGHRLFEEENINKKADRPNPSRETSKKSIIKDNKNPEGFFYTLFNSGQEKVDKVIKECEEIIDEDTKIFSSQQYTIKALSLKNEKMEKYIDSLQNELLISKRASSRYRSESRRLNRQNESLDDLIDLLSREIQ